MKLITTSWDDGHPLDHRIAELLDKYNLKGTFYIPRVNPGHTVMHEYAISALGKRFEIGGHTLGHVNLNAVSAEKVTEEVAGCYRWIEELTGTAPVSFCPPFGSYNAKNLAEVYAAGFKVVRTTVLLSPYYRSPLTDTTLQVYDHPRFTYLKHLMKRKLAGSLLLWLRCGYTADTRRLLDHYLDHIDRKGGCLHIWGHSWEIEKFGLWKKLEAIFAHIANRSAFEYTENRGLLRYA